MAVMVLVLAPALLQYNERSRAEKDNKAMDEVVGAIQLAIADPAVYDELLPYSTPDNISCYVDTDSEANYTKITTKVNPDGVNQYTFDSTSRQLDETPYYAAGNMRGITITFAPNKGSNGSIYDLKQGVVNQYVQVSGNQRVGALPELYNQIKSVVGDTIINDSSTYRNSEYTIFIRLGTTGGNDASKQDAIVAYGQWSGSNLPAEVSYKLVSDRTVGDTGNTIVVNDNKWNSENGNKITVNPGDLNGGGSFTAGTIDGNQAKVGEIYAYLTDDNTLILRNSPRNDMSNIIKDYGIQNQQYLGGDDAEQYRTWTSDVEQIYAVDFETAIYPIRISNWFKNCVNLTEFRNMKNMHTNKTVWMHGVFHNCISLEYIDVSGWDVSQVTNFNMLFFNCHSLKSVDVSKWNTGNGKNMYGIFRNCYQLEYVNVSNWNLDNVVQLSCTFMGCEKLKNIDVSKWNTKKVTTMYSLFEGCKSLTSLDLSNWNTENVTEMNGMFRDCESLKYVDTSNFNTKNVTTMDYMFRKCYVLEQVDVSGWNTSKVKNFSFMFDDCQVPKVIDVSNWDTSSATTMRALFANCFAVEELDVSHFNTSNVTDMAHLFQKCYAITSLDLSSFDVSKVTDIKDMFLFCGNLTTIGNIDHWAMSSEYCNGATFAGCSKLDRKPSWYTY